MEMLIGCIFLTILLVILFIFCRNLTITIRFEQNTDTYQPIGDTFDENGEPVNEQSKATIDDVLKVVNGIMLDMEDDSHE